MSESEEDKIVRQLEDMHRFVSRDYDSHFSDSFLGQVASLIRSQAERIRVLEAALDPFMCECTGRCGKMEWLPADNATCASRHARAAMEPRNG